MFSKELMLSFIEKVLTKKECLALFIWNVVPGVNIDEACTWVGCHLG